MDLRKLLKGKSLQLNLPCTEALCEPRYFSASIARRCSARFSISTSILWIAAGSSICCFSPASCCLRLFSFFRMTSSCFFCFLFNAIVIGPIVERAVNPSVDSHGHQGADFTGCRREIEDRLLHVDVAAMQPTSLVRNRFFFTTPESHDRSLVPGLLPMGVDEKRALSGLRRCRCGCESIHGPMESGGGFTCHEELFSQNKFNACVLSVE